MDKIEKKLYKQTLSIANAIALNNYELLMERGCLENFTKENISDALNEYGGTISLIDEKNYEGRFDCYKCPNNIYETELDLVIDESLSDLTLMCEYVVENDMVMVLCQ